MHLAVLVLLCADCVFCFTHVKVEHMPGRNDAILSGHEVRPYYIMGGAPMAEEADRLLTVREVARRLRVDDTTVRRWIKSGSLEAITLPHKGRRQAYRIKQSTLDKLLSGPRLPE